MRWLWGPEDLNDHGELCATIQPCRRRGASEALFGPFVEGADAATASVWFWMSWPAAGMAWHGEHAQGIPVIVRSATSGGVHGRDEQAARD